MRKSSMVMVVLIGLMVGLMAATSSAAQKYGKIVVSGVAGSTTISLSNANTIATYQIVDVYFGFASNTIASSEVVLYDTAGGYTVPVDSTTVASNGLGGSIDIDSRVLQQELGNSTSVVRPTTATNGSWWVEFVTLQDIP